MSGKIYEISIETITPFNISTGSKNDGFVKNISIKDISGKPYIPGSTIKGLLRSNYSYIVDNEDKVNEVFGNLNDKYSNVVVDNMILHNNEYKSNIRYGNAIDRYRKVTKENALYSKEVISGTFRGKIKVISDNNEDDEDFKLAIMMITKIGSGKHNGFGRVKVNLLSIKDINDKANTLNSETNNTEESFRVILDFKSPLLVGGRNKDENNIESDEVIKGSVVRAAFAKVILDNCPERKILFKKEKDNKEEILKDNWVYLRNENSCEKCKFKNVCKKFSNIRFSYFYPLGTEAIPLSTKVCKENNDHGFVDIMVSEEKCKVCEKSEQKNARLEFKTGLRTKGKNSVPYKVVKSYITRNAINKYNKTSKDGVLYSVSPVSATCRIKEVDSKGNEVYKKKILYQGKIDGISESELKYFSELRVGADTTVGFGLCSLIIPKNQENKKLDSEIIEEFSKKYKEVNKKENKLNYFAIKLIADAKIDFEAAKEEYVKANKEEKNYSYFSTEDYKKIWKIALKIDEDLDVDKVYTEIINYRGYDTSKTCSDKRSEPVAFITKGTIIVLSTDKPIKDVLQGFENRKLYFGEKEDNINGFGQYEIYDGGISNANS